MVRAGIRCRTGNASKVAAANHPKVDIAPKRTRLSATQPITAGREESNFGAGVARISTLNTGVNMNSTRKIAAGILFILFLTGLAFSLFFVVYGLGIASEYADQGGGGLAVLIGFGMVGIGCFMGISIFAVGLPATLAMNNWARPAKSNNGDEGDPEDAENFAIDGPESVVASYDILKALKAAWTGDEKLWKVFWIYHWLFGFALGLGLDFSIDFGLPAELAVRAVVVVWLVWVTVAQWRCSFNASWRGWGYVVRALLCISAGVWVLDFYLFMFPPAFL